MSCLGKLTCLVAWTLLASNSLAQDEVPEWPKPTWRFESVDTPLVLERWYREPDVPVPRFAATFAGRIRHAWGRNTTAAAEDLLATAAAERLSEQQRTFVRHSRFMAVHGQGLEGQIEFPRGHVRYDLFAVSQEDAEVMVEAVLEIYNRSRREKFEERRKELAEAPQILADARVRLAEVDAEITRHRNEYTSAREALAYEGVDNAKEDIQQLDKVLRSIEFDIAGASAKIQAIDRIKGDDGTRDPDTLRMLDRMMVEQDVEMAGLLARKAAVQTARDAAQDFCTSYEQYRNARTEKVSLQRSIDHARSLLEEGWGGLEDLPENMRPIEVYGDEVTIRPLLLPDD
jgi:hypothetical protein